MRKKIVPVVFLVLFLIAGIIALTQESDDFSPGPAAGADDEGEGEFSPDGGIAEEEGEEPPREMPEWVKPARWFRSNAGGMALEEVPSRTVAMRGEYALVIDFTESTDLPDILTSYYHKEYIIEIRTFYKSGEKVRTQWIFREESGSTKLVAVFLDTEDGAPDGFIETYGDNSLLSSEIRFFENGERNKTEFFYTEGIVLRAVVWEWEWEEDDPPEDIQADEANETDETDEAIEAVEIVEAVEEAPVQANRTGDYKRSYTDYYRYNRSWFLRNVERVFHEEQLVRTQGDSLNVAFPNRIMDAARNDKFINEKLNSVPDFFGDTLVNADDRIVFIADARGRILTQTLYDEEENVVWVITNTWSNDRIVSITRVEGDDTLLIEFEFDKDGNRILERNLRNGALERTVRTEKKYDYEELYMNDKVILLAVWEDGRKISETRVR